MYYKIACFISLTWVLSCIFICLHLCKYTLFDFDILKKIFFYFGKKNIADVSKKFNVIEFLTKPSINIVKRIKEYFFIPFFCFSCTLWMFEKVPFLIWQCLHTDKTIVEQVSIRFIISKIIFKSMLQWEHLVLLLNLQMLFYYKTKNNLLMC